jgi:hypothetical protein
MYAKLTQGELGSMVIERTLTTACMYVNAYVRVCVRACVRAVSQENRLDLDSEIRDKFLRRVFEEMHAMGLPHEHRRAVADYLANVGGHSSVWPIGC